MGGHRLRRLIEQPVTDTARGLDRCLDGGAKGLAWIALGLAVGWWIYVPCHELLHAAGCVLAGGEVTRLEISGIHGGGLLQRLAPFVAVGEGHAGRLSGFDTRGSDLTYLATDLAPFVLTLIPGVFALRAAGAGARPFLFGLALPIGLAPFLSATGDAYEIGAILVTRLGPWSAGGMPMLLRGDDLFERAARVSVDGGLRAWSGLGLALGLGFAWAMATYLVGGAIATRLGAPPVESRRSMQHVDHHPR